VKNAESHTRNNLEKGINIQFTEDVRSKKVSFVIAVNETG